MALRAAAEALARLLAEGSGGLFEAGPEAAQRAARGLSKPTGLARLGRAYNSRFAYKALDYYLSRTLTL
jgi:hypothetical protein